MTTRRPFLLLAMSCALTAHAAEPALTLAFRVPEGNHRVTVQLAGAAPVTVWAGSRQLVLERAGPSTHTFTVNVRTPALPDGTAVHLNERERALRRWDGRLWLEFAGGCSAVRWIDIEPAPAGPTLYLAGDSTVADQPEAPWCGWGQMLPRFVAPQVAVANHAESGLSARTFLAHRRFDKILAALRAGDAVLFQFGHNDQKETGAGEGAFLGYTERLREMVAAVRARGATPVLVTPVYRRRFDTEGRLDDTLGHFPIAVRRLAAAADVPLVDLHALSARLFQALGPEGSKRAFVHYAAGTFPGQERELRDDSHFSSYGGYLLARCVVEGLRGAAPELAARILAVDLPPFDPDRPPAPDTRGPPASTPPRPLVPPAGH